MKKIASIIILLLLGVTGLMAQTGTTPPYIEVSGSATINIVPDRITVEIGMEEYYKQRMFGDSILIKLGDIEKSVRRTLNQAGVPDSQIFVSDMGNHRNRDIATTFLMAKRLAAIVNDFSQIEAISRNLDRNGMTSFNIVKTDNSQMEKYNREGLKAALDAARLKAQFIAENEGLQLSLPYEIIETTNELCAYSTVSNVAYDGGSGMENMRRIPRRYSVKVRYRFNPEQ